MTQRLGDRVDKVGRDSFLPQRIQMAAIARVVEHQHFDFASAHWKPGDRAVRPGRLEAGDVEQLVPGVTIPHPLVELTAIDVRGIRDDRQAEEALQPGLSAGGSAISGIVACRMLTPGYAVSIALISFE